MPRTEAKTSRVPRWSSSTLALGGLLAAALGYSLGCLPSSPETKTAAPTTAPSDFSSTLAPAPSTSLDDFDPAWENLASQPNTPATAEKRSALLENLARTQPQRALTLALAERNWQLRDQLRDAALRGWGATAPDAAADWAMNHRLDVRMQCVAAVLTGAAENPAEAVRVATRICESDPEPAADYGHVLITALVEKTGDFATATRFASNVGTERQAMLLDSAYYQYARHQPEKALDDLSAIADPRIRESARAGLLSGWADASAHQLAEYALKLPPGEDRVHALEAALPRWVERDPTAATAWIGRFDPSPDLDRGMASIATLPSLVSQKPETAMEWADNITDRAQRIMTKHEVFTQWAGRDLKAARRFAENTRNPDERDMMLEALSAYSTNSRP